MKTFHGWAICVGLAWFATATAAFGQYGPSPPPSGQPAAGQPMPSPDQPVSPNDPVLIQRNQAGTYPPQPGPQPGGRVYGPMPAAAPPPPPAALPPPFTLSPYDEAQLDRVLQQWEQQSSLVRTFSCDFTRWEYDPVFTAPGQSPDKPKRIVQGRIIYQAPDRGLFSVEKEAIGGRMDKSPNPEKWICDGKSVFEYKFTLKQVVEIPLPPDMQGKAIQDGPLPFIFGAEARKLRQRYFMRVTTPPTAKDEIWLEARPRFQRDAANFQRVEMILKVTGMQPFGLQMYDPNGQSRTIYQFDNAKVNATDFTRIFFDPFKAALPDRTWTKIVEGAAASPPPTQASRPAIGPRR